MVLEAIEECPIFKFTVAKLFRKEISLCLHMIKCSSILDIFELHGKQSS